MMTLHSNALHYITSMLRILHHTSDSVELGQVASGVSVTMQRPQERTITVERTASGAQTLRDGWWLCLAMAGEYK